MRSANLIVIVLFTLAASSHLNAQVQSVAEVFRGQQPCFTSRIGHRDAKWYRHELGIFSICIPETMVRRRSAHCGEKCYIFENEYLFFDTDLTGSAWRPTFQKRYPSYTTATKPIDGKQSVLWYFEDFGEYRYVAGVNFIFDRGQVGMGAYLFSRTTDPRPIAEKMFGSIKFIKADPN
jgi:hypothetical protein